MFIDIYLLSILYVHIMHICIFFLFFKLNWIGLSVGIVKCGAAENERKNYKNRKKKS